MLWATKEFPNQKKSDSKIRTTKLDTSNCKKLNEGETSWPVIIYFKKDQKTFLSLDYFLGTY